jgi:hypothetical protein
MPQRNFRSRTIRAASAEDSEVILQDATRDKIHQINGNFVELLGEKAEIVNAGSGPDAGDGDTLRMALDKIHRNLLLLKKAEK